MSTFSLKQSEIKKDWLLIDAKDVILGRLASKIAYYLRGKHKHTFTPHMDCGDCVVVINADKVAVTGDKMDDKMFYWHTGWPGGIKERKLSDRMSASSPKVIIKAVERMLPKSVLGRQMLTHLRVYAGDQHEQNAQNPKKIDFGSMNKANIVRGDK